MKGEVYGAHEGEEECYKGSLKEIGHLEDKGISGIIILKMGHSEIG